MQSGCPWHIHPPKILPQPTGCGRVVLMECPVETVNSSNPSPSVLLMLDSIQHWHRVRDRSVVLAWHLTTVQQVNPHSASLAPGMCTPRMCILQWESRSNLPALPNCLSQLTPTSKHIDPEDRNGGEFRLISLQTIPRPRSPNDFNLHKLLVYRFSSLMVAICQRIPLDHDQTSSFHG